MLTTWVSFVLPSSKLWQLRFPSLQGTWNFNHHQTIWDQKLDTSVRASLRTLWELEEHFGNQEKPEKQNCCNWRTADPSSSLPDAHYWRHVSKYSVTTCTGIWTSSLLHTAAFVSRDVSLNKFPVTTQFLLLHFNQMLAAYEPASSWKLTMDGWENKDDKNSDFYDKLPNIKITQLMLIQTSPPNLGITQTMLHTYDPSPSSC